ncbi:hypothetical protein FOZ60_007536 [Perkinsus olseni]|uniref:Uncharacterized protein n=1 Tax=Perkinsus olseni TaxID=32597 RepID=A0A7J6PPI4_PEROL|nr:hypothetical protein FOZ60_007536 [Perkinsus olseni]
MKTWTLEQRITNENQQPTTLQYRTLFTQTLDPSTVDTVKVGAKQIRQLEETAVQTIDFCSRLSSGVATKNSMKEHYTQG